MSWQEEDDDTIACPSCRRDMHEEAVCCPHCGHFPCEDDAPRGRSWWFLICAIICLLLAAGWALQML